MIRSDEDWMNVALHEARLAAAKGEVPVGCVIVGPDGRQLSSGHNLRESTHDPTAHAEIVALRAASRARGNWYMDDVTVYVTLEPCPMCAGALVHARVKRVVFGCTDPKGGGMVTLFEIGTDRRLNHRFEVTEGVLRKECAEALSAFFGALRAKRRYLRDARPHMSGTVVVEPVVTPKEREVFFRVPWSLGMDKVPNWVPPMLDDHRRLLDEKKSPFLKHGEIACFIAKRDGAPVGRISVQTDKLFEEIWATREPAEADTAFFGFFDCEDNQETAKALFAKAEEWARSKGKRRLRGPFTLDSKGDVGVLVEGFDTKPLIGTVYNLPYVGGLIESAGYAKRKDFFGWWYTAGTPIEATTQRLANGVRALPNVKIRIAEMSKFASEVEIVRDVYNEAWGDNWCYTPFTQEEIDIMASEYKAILDPELVIFAEVDGKPAAVCLAAPDLNEITADFGGELMRRPWNLIRLLWRLKWRRPKAARLIILGVRKEFRRSRKYGVLAAVLYEEVAKRGLARGYTGGELSWTLEDNDMINRGIERMGAKLYKRWRVFEKTL